jgi:hypothetical protein
MIICKCKKFMQVFERIWYCRKIKHNIEKIQIENI